MKAIILSAIVGLAARGAAQIAEACFDGGVCYQLNIPESTASSGQGDIFLRVSAPTSFTWAAIGQGDGMTGSQMFVVYASSDTNVTVSPRLGVGEVEPVHSPNTQITILEGTGIENGQMTANFRCSNCHTWNGGSMDFTAGAVQWVHAAHRGSPLNSADPAASILQHNAGDAHWDWDMSPAKGGNSVNPFTEFSVTSNGNTGGSPAPAPVPLAVLIAHGVLASAAMVIFFPLGSIALRLFNFQGLIWVHAAIQGFSYLVLTAGIGLGIHKAVVDGYLNTAHAIIGLTVFALLFFQPFLGVVHHRQFKKSGHRTFWSVIHIWLGRIVITLGIINGGLGLLLAGNSNWGNIVYGTVAGVMWTAWVVASLYGEMRRKRSPRQYLQSSGPLANEAYAPEK